MKDYYVSVFEKNIPVYDKNNLRTIRASKWKIKSEHPASDQI